MKNYFALIFIVVAKVSFAQIPNNSFDTWHQMNGYSSPTNWDNLNQITYSKNVFTCEEMSPGLIGTSSLMLMTKNVVGKGVVPGIVVSGKIDTNTYKPISGYAFTSRPQELNYNIQYMPYDPSDSICVTVFLSKWNTLIGKRDTIAFGGSYYNGMAHSWFVGITYLNYLSASNPDSAMIVISSSSSNPKAGSYLYIDNLQFGGIAIGINENEKQNNDILIYPNPTNDIVNITTERINELKIYNALGKLIYTENNTNTNELEVNTTYWSKGVYNVQVNNHGKLINKQLIVN